MQRFNARLLHDSLPALDCTDWMIVLHFVFPSIFKLPRDYIDRGLKIIINNHDGADGGDILIVIQMNTHIWIDNWIRNYFYNYNDEKVV